MTELQVQPAAEPRPAPGRRPKALPTVLAAAAVFAVAFEFLAFQLTSGRDPAIGGTPAAVTRQGEQPVQKRLVITKVIGSSRGGSSTTSAGAGTTTAAPAPVTTSTS